MDLNKNVNNVIVILEKIEDYGSVTALIDSLKQTKTLLNESKDVINDSKNMYLPLISFILKITNLYDKQKQANGQNISEKEVFDIIKSKGVNNIGNMVKKLSNIEIPSNIEILSKKTVLDIIKSKGVNNIKSMVKKISNIKIPSKKPKKKKDIVHNAEETKFTKGSHDKKIKSKKNKRQKSKKRGDGS